MIDNDDNDGERELVLGNRQLLGIFFVATLLCGVFFAMGYVVGGNSARSGAAAAAAENSSAPVAEGKREDPLAPQQSTAATDTAANSAGTAGTGDEASSFSGAESRVTDNPAAAGAQPPAYAAAPVAAAPAPVQYAPPPAAKSVPAPSSSTAAGVVLSVPEKAASYWQVAAPERPQADVLVKQLRDKGLPAILATSSNPKLFRVLVGPYRSTLSLADAKRKLMDVGGFDGLIVQKY